MIRWLRNRWNATRRRIDLEILWPQCKSQARDMDHAKAAFAVHAFTDEAWLALGDKLESTIDALE